MTVIRCESCGLVRQLVPDTCPRCHASMGLLIEIPIGDNSESAEGRNQASLSLGQALRRLRLRQGKTQALISAAAGLDRAHWSRVEANTASPTLKTVLLMFKALGVDTVYVRIRERRPFKQCVEDITHASNSGRI